ncbi:hypothetical protein MAR_013731 [Mya arenaria]|uniref:Uncharacterized protein n=1 Tax=Mya arenaria TaxID=6604 RepID=A0ABY7G0Q8_MYAAR|nr:hypothetical protein MAR_013731 [Mya arenaria]
MTTTGNEYHLPAATLEHLVANLEAMYSTVIEQQYLRLLSEVLLAPMARCNDCLQPRRVRAMETDDQSVGVSLTQLIITVVYPLMPSQEDFKFGTSKKDFMNKDAGSGGQYYYYCNIPHHRRIRLCTLRAEWTVVVSNPVQPLGLGLRVDEHRNLWNVWACIAHWFHVVPDGFPEFITYELELTLPVPPAPIFKESAGFWKFLVFKYFFCKKEKIARQVARSMSGIVDIIGLPCVEMWTLFGYQTMSGNVDPVWLSDHTMSGNVDDVWLSDHVWKCGPCLDIRACVLIWTLFGYQTMSGNEEDVWLSDHTMSGNVDPVWISEHSLTITIDSPPFPLPVPLGVIHHCSYVCSPPPLPLCLAIVHHSPFIMQSSTSVIACTFCSHPPVPLPSSTSSIASTSWSSPPLPICLAIVHHSPFIMQSSTIAPVLPLSTIPPSSCSPPPLPLCLAIVHHSPFIMQSSTIAHMSCSGPTLSLYLGSSTSSIASTSWSSPPLPICLAIVHHSPFIMQSSTIAPVLPLSTIPPSSCSPPPLPLCLAIVHHSPFIVQSSTSVIAYTFCSHPPVPLPVPLGVVHHCPYVLQWSYIVPLSWSSPPLPLCLAIVHHSPFIMQSSTSVIAYTFCSHPPVPLPVPLGVVHHCPYVLQWSYIVPLSWSSPPLPLCLAIVHHSPFIMQSSTSVIAYTFCSHPPVPLPVPLGVVHHCPYVLQWSYIVPLSWSSPPLPLCLAIVHHSPFIMQSSTSVIAFGFEWIVSAFLRKFLI